jgi:hypothetical protein
MQGIFAGFRRARAWKFREKAFYKSHLVPVSKGEFEKGEQFAIDWIHRHPK